MTRQFNPSDSGYVEVPERIAEFRRLHPEGSLQSEVITLPEAFNGTFVAMRGYAYRTPDDPRPGIGHAWEPVPGQTPYTKDSELQNAETSAWGRAIVAALAADAKRPIASAEEIRNRVPSGNGGTRAATKKAPQPEAPTPPSDEHDRAYWNRLLHGVANELGWDHDTLKAKLKKAPPESWSLTNLSDAELQKCAEWVLDEKDGLHQKASV